MTDPQDSFGTNEPDMNPHLEALHRWSVQQEDGMTNGTDGGYMNLASEMIAWLLEREFIIPIGKWTRNPSTGQLDPSGLQLFYDAAELDEPRNDEEDILWEDSP